MGAGCAGSVVASRLSEVQDARVLLLEAGKSAPIESAIPFLVLFDVGGQVDWRVRGKPQTRTHFGYENNVSRYFLLKCTEISSE